MSNLLIARHNESMTKFVANAFSNRFLSILAIHCCSPSYDKYVVSFTKDLEEAMVIAQEHVTKEQRWHTELYNKRVKGPVIDVGDRMLLVNRKEREKRKVADLLSTQ